MNAPDRISFKTSAPKHQVIKSGDLSFQNYARRQLSSKIANFIMDKFPMIETPNEWGSMEYSMDLLVMTREQFDLFLGDYKNKVIMGIL